jgi:hypothetical protein
LATVEFNSTCGMRVGSLAQALHLNVPNNCDLGVASISTASRENFVHIFQVRKVASSEKHSILTQSQMIIPGSVLYVTSLWAVKVTLVRTCLYVYNIPLVLILPRSFSTNSLLQEQTYTRSTTLLSAG